MQRYLIVIVCVLSVIMGAGFMTQGAGETLVDDSASQRVATQAGGGHAAPTKAPRTTSPTSPTASPTTTTSAPQTTPAPSTTSSPSSTAAPTTSTPAETTTGAPPRTDGYFTTRAVGSYSALPTGTQCAQTITRSSWEPRPENTAQNHTMPDAQAVHASFAERPRGSSYDFRWDQWLLPRVDGQFTGTTDEIIQWAACKWGISDNLLRAQAVRESTWYQGLHFSDGQCYWNRGCGDAFGSATAASTTYCTAVGRAGHDYQRDTNSTVGAYPYTPTTGLCPKTFSIIGVMAWDDPAWQAPGTPYLDNQNGTFPFARDSTAFALDYEASFLRGCYEGWIGWLGPAGDMDGCVGAWYSGDWHTTAADGYIARVQGELTNHTWLTANFADGKGNQYKCDAVKGCPQ